MSALFFWLFALGMIVSALVMILHRSAVASLLCFVVAMICLAGLFVQLSAFFLAVIEILVAAGAVMVLFLFVIMLLDLTAPEKLPRQILWRGASLLLALGLFFLFARTLNTIPMGSLTAEMSPVPAVDANASAQEKHLAAEDDTHQIGHLLFGTYVAPFEVTSLLILVATIGVIVICQRDDPAKKSET